MSSSRAKGLIIEISSINYCIFLQRWLAVDWPVTRHNTRRQHQQMKFSAELRQRQRRNKTLQVTAYVTVKSREKEIIHMTGMNFPQPCS